MPDPGTVPVWAWIAIGVIAAAAVLGTGAWFLWGRGWLMRRHLVVLVGKRERIRAALRILEAVMRHLADEPDESLIEFAADPAQADRRALVELRDRMLVVTDELDIRPVPSRLVRVAEELADAAYVIAEESGRIGDAMGFDEVLGALTEVDMARVEAQATEADRWVDDACAEFGVEETSVYGGGLYI